jgi:hypothetical protein
MLMARAEDGVALEAENRPLLRRISTRNVKAARGAQDPLSAIEARLASMGLSQRDRMSEQTWRVNKRVWPVHRPPVSARRRHFC